MAVGQVHAEELLACAVEAALRAGALLRTGFGRAVVIERKEGRHNLVTEYDRQSEALIVETIRRRFPDSSFLAEESGQLEGRQQNLCWVVDPLDGTVNFAHGIPVFCVSIAAVLEGELQCGVIYQPMLGELFTALRGAGAWLNGHRLRVSSVEELDEAVLVTGFPYNVAENPGNCIEHFVRFLQRGLPVRRLGSAAPGSGVRSSGALRWLLGDCAQSLGCRSRDSAGTRSRRHSHTLRRFASSFGATLEHLGKQRADPYADAAGAAGVKRCGCA
jgi:myo-inositol-1(or 4)-monophosphatase